jgi:cytochrome c
MFDTMTLTKTIGAVCGSLLVFLLTAWAASSLFFSPAGHGGDHAEQAYVIDTGESEATEEVADAGPAFAEVYAAASVDEGEKVFAKCRACHKMDGTNGTGPYLNGVVDRAKGAVEGYAFSDALLAVADQAWTPENLEGFLENPRGYMPGTKMAFAGLPKVEDRANLIAWLATQP